MRIRVRVNATPEKDNDPLAIPHVTVWERNAGQPTDIAMGIAIDRGLTNACHVYMSPREARQLALDLLKAADKLDP